MSHHLPVDTAALFTQEFWDARYGATDQVWSGNPNPRLVEHVADLTPGTALDVGCGEGADAIWLAAQGWQVTAIDVSPVALERAANHAVAAGEQIAARITWQQADILVWEPPPRQFDLVSAQFMQLPLPARDAVYRRLAAAVRPGGALLIVGHHPLDLHAPTGRPHLPELFFTADELAALLDPATWQILVAAAPARQATNPEGQPVTVHDAVLLARRHG
jgi:SAM-dependent methyltransferase